MAQTNKKYQALAAQVIVRCGFCFFSWDLLTMGTNVISQSYPLKLCPHKKHNVLQKWTLGSLHISKEKSQKKGKHLAPNFWCPVWGFVNPDRSTDSPTTSLLLQFDFHSVIIRLVSGAEDRSLDVQSFCRRFHRDRKGIHVSRPFLIAEELDEVTVISRALNWHPNAKCG